MHAIAAASCRYPEICRIIVAPNQLENKFLCFDSNPVEVPAVCATHATQTWRTRCPYTASQLEHGGGGGSHCPGTRIRYSCSFGLQPEQLPCSQLSHRVLFHGTMLLQPQIPNLLWAQTLSAMAFACGLTWDRLGVVGVSIMIRYTV